MSRVSRFRNDILGRFSRFLGLDVQYFFSSGFWVTLRYGTVSLLGVLLTIAFARLGSKEVFGQYQAIIALIGIFSIFSLPGLNLAALKAVTEGHEGAIKSAVKMSFVASWFAVPFIFGYAWYVSVFQGDSGMALVLVLAGLCAPFFYAPNTWYVFYEGRSFFLPVTIRTLLVSFVLTATLISLLVVGAPLVWLIACYFLIQTIFGWYFFWEVRRKIVSRNETALDKRFGIAVTFQKSAFLITENLPVLSISFLYGYASLAVFQVAYLFVNAMAGFLSGLSATYLPLLFRYAQIAYGKILLQQLAFGVVLFGVFRVAIEVFFLLFYGEAYRESLDLVRFLSYLSLILPLKTFLVSFFTARNKNGTLVIIYLLANATALGALYAGRGLPMLVSATVYLYALHLIVLVPLLALYFFTASRKTDSMRSVSFS